jgi:hypothetical protein
VKGLLPPRWGWNSELNELMRKAMVLGAELRQDGRGAVWRTPCRNIAMMVIGVRNDCKVAVRMGHSNFTGFCVCRNSGA